MLQLILSSCCFCPSKKANEPPSDDRPDIYPIFARAISFLEQSYAFVKNHLPPHLYSFGIALSLVGLVSSILLQGAFTTPIFALLAVAFAVARYFNSHLESENKALKEAVATKDQLIENLSKALANNEKLYKKLEEQFAGTKKELELVKTTILDAMNLKSGETKEYFEQHRSDTTAWLSKIEEFLTASKDVNEILVKILTQNDEILRLTQALSKKQVDTPQKTIVDNEDLV